MDGRTGGGRKKRKDIKNGTQQAFHQCKNRQRQRFISNALCSFSGHRNGLDGIIPYKLHQMQWRKRSSYRLQSNNPRSQWLRDKTATSISNKKDTEKKYWQTLPSYSTRKRERTDQCQNWQALAQTTLASPSPARSRQTKETTPHDGCTLLTK